MKLEQEITETNRSTKLPFFCLLLILLLLLVGFAFIKKIHRIENHIKEQDEQLSQLSDDIMKYQIGLDGYQTNTETTSDVEPDRYGTDSQTAESFLKMLLTWNDYESYQTIRTTLVTDYGVDGASSLLTKFMPDVEAKVFGTANMKLKEITSYLVKEENGANSYFAICDVSSKVDGNTGNGKVGVFYTILEDGSITNISAYTLIR